MIRRFVLWLLPFALLAPGVAHAEASEAAVKATFLVKFGAYVTWPTPGESLTICAVGRDILGTALEQAAKDQQVDGRAVVVHRLETIAPDSGCDIAYLAGSSRQSVKVALAALQSAPVLTVTDSRLSNDRGMVHFQIIQRRVRFHVDDQAAADSGLVISSKLLGIAMSVHPRTSGR